MNGWSRRPAGNLRLDERDTSTSNARATFASRPTPDVTSGHIPGTSYAIARFSGPRVTSHKKPQHESVGAKTIGKQYDVLRLLFRPIVSPTNPLHAESKPVWVITIIIIDDDNPYTWHRIARPADQPSRVWIIMEGRLPAWEDKFKAAIKKNERNEIRNCLSELHQLPSSDTVSQSAPEEGEHDKIELEMIKDGARITNGTLSTEAGDRILEALANSKHTFARGFLRSENPHESAANLRALGYFTPSFVRDPELVRCMIRSGFRFDEPDPSLSGIDQFRMDGQLKILNRYLVISDPVYVSALFLEDRTEAPVARLWQLERTFRDFAAKDYEFTSEYDALRRRCEEFGVSLLDQCRDKHEVHCILDSAVGREDNGRRTAFPLNMLHQAIIGHNAEVRVVAPISVSNLYSQFVMWCTWPTHLSQRNAMRFNFLWN